MESDLNTSKGMQFSTLSNVLRVKTKILIYLFDSYENLFDSYEKYCVISQTGN